MNLFCTNCGAPLDESQNFCVQCGAPVERDESPAPPPPQEPAAPTASNPAPEPATPTEPLSSSVYVPDEGIANFFTLDHNGGSRLNRLRYFKRTMLLSFVVSVLYYFADSLFADALGNPTAGSKFAMQAIHVVSIALTYLLDIRRLKDLGKSDTLARMLLFSGMAELRLMWKYDKTYLELLAESAYKGADSVVAIFTVVAIAQIAANLYLLFAPGEKGPNKYGADPLGPVAAKG